MEKYLTLSGPTNLFLADFLSRYSAYNNLEGYGNRVLCSFWIKDPAGVEWVVTEWGDNAEKALFHAFCLMGANWGYW